MTQHEKTQSVRDLWLKQREILDNLSELIGVSRHDHEAFVAGLKAFVDMAPDDEADLVAELPVVDERCAVTH